MYSKMPTEFFFTLRIAYYMYVKCHVTAQLIQLELFLSVILKQEKYKNDFR